MVVTFRPRYCDECARKPDVEDFMILCIEAATVIMNPEGAVQKYASLLSVIGYVRGLSIPCMHLAARKRVPEDAVASILRHDTRRAAGTRRSS